MANIELITVLGGMMAVPCIIAITRGNDKAMQSFAAAGTIVGTWLALHPYVDFLRDLTSGTLYQVLGILALVLSIVIGIRLKHQVLGTLIITAGTLIAIRALGIVSG